MRLPRATWRLAFALLATAMVLHCGDPEAPPPAPVETDYPANYDPASGELSFPADRLSPSLGPLRLVAVATRFDSTAAVVHARVAIHNSATVAMAGPDGAFLFGFAPATVSAANAILDPPDAALPPLPEPDAGLLDHRRTFGADGMLSPGETSSPVEWKFHDPGNLGFGFRVRWARTGLAAAGEIYGVVFDDRDRDGGRDDIEPGLHSAWLTLAGPDSSTFAGSDSSGQYSFVVASPGTYHLTALLPGCCPTTTRSTDITIRVHGGGGLTGWGHAGFGCVPGAPERPVFRVVDIRALDGSVPPCVAAEPCTIPFRTSFAIRFTGERSCDPITGFQWQGLPPEAVVAPPWQPLGSETLFLSAGLDTVALGGPTGRDTLWSARHDTITVHYRSTGVDTIRSGNFIFRARIRDGAGLQTLMEDGTQRIVLNYDPDTELYTGPAGCAGPRARLGWITGIGSVDFPVADWISFCAGDTLPIRSRVRFYARGWDDRRDRPIDPVRGLAETRYAYRFVWSARHTDYTSMEFWPAWPPGDWPLPQGGTWRGGSAGWEACPFDFTFFAAAVDEHGKLDGTPDSLAFYVSGAPAIDSVGVPSVVVLVPTCRSGLPFCRDPGSFGPDTVLVSGQYVAAANTPFAAGRNRFTLPLRAWGHDHPRDRNAAGRSYYSDSDEGRIRSWRFGLDCVGPGCRDLAVPGEGVWREDTPSPGDPPGRQVFDGPEVEAALDTVCATSPCDVARIRLVLDAPWLGAYDFSIEGRDTSPSQTCTEPLFLSPSSTMRVNRVGEAGRTTARLARRVVLLQLEDVRPTVAPSGLPSPSARPSTPRP